MTNITVVVVSLAGFAVAACESTMDPDKYQQIMAKYAVLDTHKAIVVDTENYKFYYTWSQSSPDQALARAKSNCEGESGQPCVPVAINNTQVYDPLSGSVAKQQRNDESNRQLLSTVQTMQTILMTRH
jgi:hypothetical protein